MLKYIKKILVSGATTLTISNNEMENAMKIVISLEDSGLLLKGVSETIQNEAKEQKGGFLSMLLCTLGASLLGNLLTGRAVIAKRQGRGTYRVRKGKGKRVLRAGYGNNNNKMDF